MCKTHEINENNEIKEFKIPFNLYCGNLRGFLSKQKSLIDIMYDNRISHAFFTETHMVGNYKPRVDGFTSYFRNRNNQVKEKGGGVCILIPEHQKKDAVQVYSGNEAEIVAVRLNCYSPPLTLICMYGSLENNGVVENGLSELDNLIESQLRQKCNILLGGDFNCWIGDMIPGNDPSTNPAGLYLKRIVEKYDLEYIMRFLWFHDLRLDYNFFT